MSQKNSGFEIKAEQRQSWLSIAMVWAGGMICVPCLMIGGVLVSGGLSFGQIIASILLGYGMICAYMIFIGMQACDTGLPVSVMASGALGEKGARYIISTILAIACIGWFGIQSGVCGSAFASLGANMLGYESASPAAVTICSLIWGAIMLLTACLGFKGLKWLNYLAVPALVVVCLYGIIASMVQNDGAAVLAAYDPQVSSGLVFGMSMVVASFALGGLISADYCRFAKSRGDVVKSSIVGVIPAGLFMLLTGGVMSIVTGQYDISIILSNLGVPFFGLLALVLATWTTNVTNAYSGGLALSNLLGFDESKFKITTGIAGAVGTLLAAFGVLGKFEALPQPDERAFAAAGRRDHRQLLDCRQGTQRRVQDPRRRLCAGADRLSGRRVRRLPDGRHVCLLLLPCQAERSLLRRPGKRHRCLADPVRHPRKSDEKMR